jgi:hypothetical protein
MKQGSGSEEQVFQYFGLPDLSINHFKLLFVDQDRLANLNGLPNTMNYGSEVWQLRAVSVAQSHVGLITPILRSVHGA